MDQGIAGADLVAHADRMKRAFMRQVRYGARGAVPAPLEHGVHPKVDA